MAAQHRRNKTKTSSFDLPATSQVFFGFLVGMLVGLAVGYNVGRMSRCSPLVSPHHVIVDGDGLALTSNNSSTSNSQSGDQQGAGEDENGWKTIHVFYGNRSILPSLISYDAQHSHRKTFFFHLHEPNWYSQCLQDRIVYELLDQKRGGYFLDLASNHARDLSNSYSLETYFDWNGLVMEANPVYWDSLSFRRCTVVGAVVGHHRMEQVTFRISEFMAGDAGLLGGVVGEDFDHKTSDEPNAPPTRGRQPQRDLIRFTVPLLEVLERFHAPHVIDYFSLDVEGAESYILSGFPLGQYTIKTLTIERPKEDAVQLLTSHGYVCLAKLTRWGETVWGHSSYLEEMNLSVLGISYNDVRNGAVSCNFK